ncbi:MAG: ABC transporter substrate-binding protein [Actinomycetota bacterium]|nr:ABC transporter substrate-binding protein [Actinomycetota bacterium]
MMKIRSKSIGGLVLAMASITALAACSSSSSSSHNNGGSTNASGAVTPPGAIGSVPAAATGTQKAGTITWAEQPNASPNWILPLVPSASNTVGNNFTFIWEMWRPLIWTVDGVQPIVDQAMSIANTPVYSNGDKTVTVSLKSSYKWSNGQPITANDLLFYIDLIKAAIKVSATNWAGYVPGHFPDNLVSTSSPDASTLVMNLKTPVNPTWFTDNYLGQGPIIPLPSAVWAKTSTSGTIVPATGWTPATMTKIFTFLTAQSKSLSTYATNPLWQVVDGPYKLSAYNTTSGGFTMVPNTTYGGPHATTESTFVGVPFTSDTAEFNAIKAGSIDVANVDYSDVPQLPQIVRQGYSYVGEPDYGMNFGNYNFKDKTGDFNNIISQLYVRQALAHLVNDQGWITAFMHGAGAPAYGPIPAFPRSPYLPSNAATDPYPYSVSAAVGLLKSHGWTVTPGGTDVCTTAGTGAGDCGAGIPAGTKFAFNYIYSTSPSLIGLQAEDFASKAKQAGISITLTSSNFNFMIANYLDPSAPANENKWAMEDFGGETENPYATTFGLFNTTGPNQVGDYSSPTADALINNSINGADPTAVQKEASFLTTDQPVQFQPVPDYIWAWKNTLSGPQASFENLTQYYATPEFWYFTK